MNMLSENPHNSFSKIHFHEGNLLSKTEDNKEFNFKNFENQKVKINYKKDQK